MFLFALKSSITSFFGACVVFIEDLKQDHQMNYTSCFVRKLTHAVDSVNPGKTEENHEHMQEKTLESPRTTLEKNRKTLGKLRKT